MSLPDFFVVGVPKGGTTALHALLAQHPGLYLSPVKEPKFYLCDGRPPPRSGQRGPGDAHSAQEWIWQRDRYEALFDAAPGGSCAVSRRRSTSTTGPPTPGWRGTSRTRRSLPCFGIRSTGRTATGTTCGPTGWSVPTSSTRWRSRTSGSARGWAPFWHYRGLGRYAEQLRSLFDHFPREQVLLLRYRELVDDPVGTLTRVDAFLGVPEHPARVAQPENMHPYVADSPRVRWLGRAVRTGAAAGRSSHRRPGARSRRSCSRHCMQRGAAGRRSGRRSVWPPWTDWPTTSATSRMVTGQSYADWFGPAERRRLRPTATAPASAPAAAPAPAPAQRAPPRRLAPPETPSAAGDAEHRRRRRAPPERPKDAGTARRTVSGLVSPAAGLRARCTHG